MLTTANFGWHAYLPLLFAPFVGSFLGLLIVRLPAGEEVIGGRSRCRHCDATLGIRDLVPLLSWLVNRGRCRLCGENLGLFYPGIEMAALLIAAWSVGVLNGWLVWATCGLGWALLVIACIDQRHMVVPDWLSLPLLPAGLVVAFFAVRENIWHHVIGVALGFAALLIVGWVYAQFRRRQGLGFGDAKLLAAIGAWVGWQGLASVVLMAALSGLALILLQRVRGKEIAMVDKLPFAPHLCFGGWVVWLYGPVVLAG